MGSSLKISRDGSAVVRSALEYAEKWGRNKTAIIYTLLIHFPRVELWLSVGIRWIRMI